MSIQEWGEAISVSLLELWDRFIGFLPALVGAVLVFVLGWIVAAALGRLAEKIIDYLKVDQTLDKTRLADRAKEAGVKIHVGRFFGGLVKWFLILVFLMASADILGLHQVTGFLNSVILYIPNVVVATVILAIAVLVGDLAYNFIKGSTRMAGVVSARALALISKWAIIIFGFLAALVQLGIAAPLVNTIFTGLVAMLAIAGGLAFGLGGKDEAAKLLGKIREEMTHTGK